MKGIYLLLALGMAASANAQDYCKQVKKEVSANKVQSDFTSPFAADNPPAVRVKRLISTDAEYPIDNFTLIFESHCPIPDIQTTNAEGVLEEKKESKLVVTFDDNTTLSDDTTDISHDYIDDRTMAVRLMYLQLSDATAATFSTKKIAKFSLAGQEVKVPAGYANAVTQYVKCIKNEK